MKKKEKEKSVNLVAQACNLSRRPAWVIHWIQEQPEHSAIPQFKKQKQIKGMVVGGEGVSQYERPGFYLQYHHRQKYK